MELAVTVFKEREYEIAEKREPVSCSFEHDDSGGIRRSNRDVQ
jgi:hypothetical protein